MLFTIALLNGTFELVFNTATVGTTDEDMKNPVKLVDFAVT